MEDTEILEKFQGKKVLVIGDFILDNYIHGTVTRVSNEAPISVVKQAKVTDELGGAGNVAATITELNGNANVIGVVGDDNEGEKLKGLLQENIILTDSIVVDKSRPTTKKSRVIVKGHHLSRLDIESEDEPSKDVKAKLMENIKSYIPDVDVVVVSDRGKGLITRELMGCLIRDCNKTGTKILVDPYPAHMDFYSGVSMMTPIPKEARTMLSLPKSEVEGLMDLSTRTARSLNTIVMMQHSKKGLYYAAPDETQIHIPRETEITDITGARDVFLGTLALLIATGAELENTTRISNLAYEITCRKLGSAKLTIREIKDALRQKAFVI